MSAIKRFAEEVSVSMGLGGEITEEVLEEAERRMRKLSKDPLVRKFIKQNKRKRRRGGLDR